MRTVKIKELYLTDSGKEVARFHKVKEKKLVELLKNDLDELGEKEMNTFSKIVSAVTDYIDSN